jgi:acetyl-CoA C-acetyltransferase
MPEALIVSAARTGVGKFLGSLKDIPATELGAVVVRECVARAGVDPESVEDVIMGCVLPAGLGQNPARQAAIKGGIPDRAGALTINKVCGSGLKAVALAAQAIRAGDLECVVAGGMESMSRSPHIIPNSREGSRLGHAQLVDSMILDGLWDKFNDFHMGITAEKVAAKYKISREKQDEYALASHRKAAEAQAAGAFAAEIKPVEIPQKKGPPIAFATDESVRADSSLQALAALRPAFQKDGTVTAGNAPGCNDGAAATLVCSDEFAKRHGLQPMARVVGYATGGMAPEWVMMAPVDAVKKLNKRLGVGIDHYDLVELNEAFAVQALGVMGELEFDPARVNVNGGAVAIGHPIGASGARILCTLLHALKARKKKRGLAALCLGGGNAVALAVEMTS